MVGTHAGNMVAAALASPRPQAAKPNSNPLRESERTLGVLVCRQHRDPRVGPRLRVVLRPMSRGRNSVRRRLSSNEDNGTLKHIACAVLLALFGTVVECSIDHGDGLIRLDARIEVSSSSGMASGVVVEFVHRYGGTLGVPRVARHRVCVTDVSGRCAGKVRYGFAGETLKFSRTQEWPRPTWWFEFFSRGRVVAMRPLPQGNTYVQGVPLDLRVEIP